MHPTGRRWLQRHRCLQGRGRALARLWPSADRLANPEAVLSRTDLRKLGYERRAVDAVFRHCPVVALPGYSRPLIRVRDYLAFLEASTYDGRTCVR
jgi:hypothetical protein